MKLLNILVCFMDPQFQSKGNLSETIFVCVHNRLNLFPFKTFSMVFEALAICEVTVGLTRGQDLAKAVRDRELRDATMVGQCL